jgi:hypothetical protein
MHDHRWLQLAVAGAVAMTAFVVPLGADAVAAREHCVLQVTGQLDTGELTTDPIDCSPNAATNEMLAASSPVIARHYTGYNATGSELDVLGVSCTGGWMNMPAGWVNVIESTYSICVVDHFDGFFLTGSKQRLTPYGGNLTTMADRTNSASYS